MFCSLFGGQIYTENVCSPVTSVRLQMLILRKPLCPVRTNHQHGMFELEELGQYNQRNSIVFHGLKENSAGVDNTTEAKMKLVCQRSITGHALVIHVPRNSLQMSRAELSSPLSAN